MCTLELLLLTVGRVGFMILLISVRPNTTTPTPALHSLRGLSASSDDDLMLMACNLPQSELLAAANVPLQPQPPLQGVDLNEPWGFGSLRSSLSQLPATGKLAGCLLFLNSDFLLTLLGWGTNSPLLGFQLCRGLCFLHFLSFRINSQASTSFLRLTIYSEVSAAVCKNCCLEDFWEVHLFAFLLRVRWEDRYHSVSHLLNMFL